MRLHQFKSPYFRYQHVICADVFSGTGSNEVGGEIIEGSPMRLLNAYHKTNNRVKNFHWWFSDIRVSACRALEMLIKDKFGMQVNARNLSAAEAINTLGETLAVHRDVFLYLVLDPNGPKDFPKIEMEYLLKEFPRRIDVVPYISATTINRCIGARNKAGLDFKGWLGQIEDFDSGFIASLTTNNRKGWIRKPAIGDPQRWTMIPTFGCMTPRNDWNRQGFVSLDSSEGQDVVKYYCGGIGNDVECKEMKRAY